jgi:dTDP-4-dehydrorhamnose reductase
MRPSYSVLDNMMLRISNMRLLPHWKVMLEAYMKERRAGSRRRAEGKDGIGYGK